MVDQLTTIAIQLLEDISNLIYHILCGSTRDNHCWWYFGINGTKPIVLRETRSSIPLLGAIEIVFVGKLKLYDITKDTSHFSRLKLPILEKQTFCTTHQGIHDFLIGARFEPSANFKFLGKSFNNQLRLGWLIRMCWHALRKTPIQRRYWRLTKFFL